MAENIRLLDSDGKLSARIWELVGVDVRTLDSMQKLIANQSLNNGNTHSAN